MLNINALIGKKYGKLTILSETDSVNQGGVNYRCVNVSCDCGNTAVKKLKHILKTKGGVKSCGCSSKRIGTLNSDTSLILSPDKKVRGIGIVGKGVYAVKYKRNGVIKYTPAFEAWLTRLKSVVSINYKKRRKCHEGIEVAEDWLNFQNFAKWYYEQVKLYGKGGVVDKDLLYLGNKVYSSSTCVYIPQAINALFTGTSGKTIGCYLHKGRYIVSTKVDGVVRYIGSSDNKEAARLMYFQARVDEVKKTVLKYQDKIHPALFYKLYVGTENYVNYYMFEKESNNEQAL